MQPTSEIAEQRVPRVGGNPADDQLMARDTNDQLLAVLQQRLEPVTKRTAVYWRCGCPLG